MLIKLNRHWNKFSSLRPRLTIRRNANKEYIGYTFSWWFLFIDHLKWFRHLRFGHKNVIKTNKIPF